MNGKNAYQILSSLALRGETVIHGLAEAAQIDQALDWVRAASEKEADAIKKVNAEEKQR